uniref:Uncharacterized protein n=1 Tax=Romanomermis culicivorax TaxID=13658 RepID=A0A915HNF0_ROMCU
MKICGTGQSKALIRLLRLYIPKPFKMDFRGQGLLEEDALVFGICQENVNAVPEQAEKGNRRADEKRHI